MNIKEELKGIIRILLQQEEEKISSFLMYQLLKNNIKTTREELSNNKLIESLIKEQIINYDGNYYFIMNNEQTINKIINWYSPTDNIRKIIREAINNKPLKELNNTSLYELEILEQIGIITIGYKEIKINKINQKVIINKLLDY